MAAAEVSPTVQFGTDGANDGSKFVLLTSLSPVSVAEGKAEWRSLKAEDGVAAAEMSATVQFGTDAANDGRKSVLLTSLSPVSVAEGKAQWLSLK